MEKKRKTLVLFFHYLPSFHFKKDGFLTPYYLGKKMGYDVKIVYWKDHEYVPDSHRGVELIPTGGYRYQWLNILCYYFHLVMNARNIDVLMRFHLTRETYLFTLIYKLLNPKGKVYVKTDIDPMDIDSNKKTGLKGRIILKLFRKCVDVVSCETTIAYEKMQKSSSPIYKYGEKLIIVPNGFDEEQIDFLNMHVKDFQNKDNIMLTVGRLGTYQKNTQMLLRAVAKVDLKDWKCFLIGTIEPDFSKEIERFYNNYPEKKSNVIFVGNINDTKELWDYYNRSKVFLLTSRFESYGLVLCEAKRFKNYIITTDVGAARDIVENGKYGMVINMDDDNSLSTEIEKAIGHNTTIDVYNDFDEKSLYWSTMLNTLYKKLTS